MSLMLVSLGGKNAVAKLCVGASWCHETNVVLSSEVFPAVYLSRK